MQSWILWALVLLVPFAVAVAHDEPRLEAFGGYSWVSTALLEGAALSGARNDLSGWNSSVTWNTTHNLGWVAEVSGFLGSSSAASGNVQTRYYSFLAGPKITHHNRSDKVEVFTHSLFGISDATLTPSSSPPLTARGFTIAAGFGMDFVVRKHVSVRPVQVDYMLGQLGKAVHDWPQNQFRVSAGIVLRWSFTDRRNTYQEPPSDRPRAAEDFKKAE